MHHDIVLRIESLTKSFPVGFWGRPVTVLEDLNLQVRRGEVFGFLGPNGAGKTTTIKILVGLIYPTGGRARILGHEAGEVHANELVGYLPETPRYYEYLTAEEFLAFHGRLLGFRRGALAARIDELLVTVGLSQARRLRLRNFSKGMLQRIGIAQALLNDPQVVILDEPLSGLDPLGRKEVRDLLLHLKSQGRTILLSSHLIQEIEPLCDRVGILVKGRLVATGRVTELLRSWSPESFELIVEGLDPQGMDNAGKIAERVVAQGDQVLLVLRGRTQVDQMIDLIRSRNASLRALMPQTRSLETLYLEVQAGPQVGGR